MDSLTVLEQQFTILDFQIYSLIATKNKFNLSEIVTLANRTKDEVKSSLEKFIQLGWVREIGKNTYQVHLPEVLSQTFERIREALKQYTSQETVFVHETSSSLDEAITAANKHIADSMNDLVLETKNLTAMLQENISEYLNKFESHRLRTFGLYRINIDSFMRTVKDDFLRALRVSLGFTPSGEPIFKEQPEVPSLPSALVIAENISKARELVKRANIKIEEENKRMTDEHKAQYKEKMLETLSNVTKEINENKEHALKVVNAEISEFQSLINNQIEEIGINRKKADAIINNTRESVSVNIAERKRMIKKRMASKTNEFIVNTKKAIKESISVLNYDLINNIKKVLKEKERTKRERFDILSAKIKRETREYVSNAKEITHVLTEIKNEINETFTTIEKSIQTLVSNQKELAEFLEKLYDSSNQELESLKFKKIIETSDKQLLELEEIKELISKFKVQHRNKETVLVQTLKQIEKQQQSIEKEQQRLEASLWDEYLNHIKEIYQSSLVEISTVILNLTENLHNEIKVLEEKIEKELESFTLEIGNVLDEVNNSVSDKMLELINATGSDLHTFEEKVLKIQENIKSSLELLINEIERTFSWPLTIIENSIKQIINNHELFIAELIRKSSSIQESMKLSLTTVLNDLERDLGAEYEELLNYFEQTKETTLGTAKTLLDDMSELITKKLDKIWTLVLQELNNLQGETTTSKLLQYTKNNVVEVRSKLESVLANHSKGINLALEMLQNSIKMSFDDLEKEITRIGGMFDSRLKELQDLSLAISSLDKNNVKNN